MFYGYVRVSSITQNIERQVFELHEYGVKNENIFIDYQSGKDFERINYQKLKKLLKTGDLLVIKSIDRLGRNYDMIIEEWFDITKNIDADIFVIDMPLLDTRQKAENLMGRFISDIVLQILSFVAENERRIIRQRQKEGIKIAKMKGIVFGRPSFQLNQHSDLIFQKYLSQEITLNNALSELKMRKSTFYKYLSKHKTRD